MHEQRHWANKQWCVRNAGIGVRGNWTQILMHRTVGLNFTDMNLGEETIHKRTNVGGFL